ncbi:MAG TPA: relaxase/mobilization nuclease domain-containing protein [Longimicrobium sp.]|nr:relaxase/mobilization nuclease domain-containing protein [Longimicrobium sp.]
MIGDATLGRSFKDLASYLEHGPREQLAPPDRVDWVESRNLPTSHPQASARIMAATARDSERTEKPVYHLIISFDPNDPVDRATMRQVADRTLRDLGLSEHQALIVAHKDRAHAHLHIMVNRVHPEDRTAWSNSWDYGRIERSLRQQEKAHGLRVVPGKHSREPGRERAPALVRGDAAFLRAVQRDAGPHLAQARSWAELERGLAAHGLSVRVHNGGFVFTDGVRKVKASEVDRAASRKNLERRLGSLGAYRARQAVASRTLDERAARVEQRAPAPASPQVQHRTPPAPDLPRPAPERAPDPIHIPPAKLGHRRIAASYRGAMDRLYTDPAPARAQFREALLRDGREAAAKTLRERPESFGRIRPAAIAVQDRARHAAGEAYRWGGRLEATGRADALRVGATMRQHNAIRAYDDAAVALENAESRLQGARFCTTS